MPENNENKKSTTFTTAFVVGSTDEKAVPEEEISNARHIEVLPQPPGVGAEVSAEFEKEFPAFNLKFAVDEEYVKNFDPTRYNYFESNVTVEPKHGPFSALHTWFITEDDRSTKVPTETNRSYGAYLETKPLELSPEDDLKFGGGFRRGRLYDPVSEVYSVETHKFNKEQSLSAEAGVLAHPGAFVGAHYKDAKFQATMRQYFYSSNPTADRNLPKLHDNKLQAQAEIKLNEKTSAYAYGTFDERTAKFEQLMLGVKHDFLKSISVIVEAGEVDSPDAPKHNGKPKGSFVLKRDF